jgi:dynactin-6
MTDTIEQYCRIGPLCEVAENEDLPDHTVLYGYDERRIDASGVDDARATVTSLQVDALRRLIASNLAKFQT